VGNCYECDMNRVLVVGASGRMGTKIVHELLARGAHVRVVHRTKPVAELVAAGAEPIAADLVNEASLAAACARIDVIVCAVQGLRDVIVDGQTRLLRAAERAGVARMLPSDYALDFFKTKEGGNRNLDLRREFSRVVDASPVRATSVLCGAFMDLLAMGAMGPNAQGVLEYWGDADTIYDFTHTDDVAKYIAAAALDNDAPRMVRVAGDSASPRDLATIFTEVRGTPITLERKGSVEDLDRAIAGMRARDEAPVEVMPVWQRMQYVRDMASGLGKLTPLDNARYSDVHPRTIRELLRRAT
jgi:uncharacterized protein YbjT (DUF2867 family)